MLILLVNILPKFQKHTKVIGIDLSAHDQCNSTQQIRKSQYININYNILLWLLLSSYYY